MKLLVIYANCHAYPIEYFLKLSNTFKSTYVCHIISILNYLNKSEITNLSDIDTINLSKADMVICQHIQNDRNYLSHNNVLSFCKPNVKILMIPHHRFSVYSIIAKNEFKFKVNNWTFIPIEIYDCYKLSETYDEFEQRFNRVIMNIKIKMKDSEITRLKNYYIDQYVQLNASQSSNEIAMTEFVLNNYETTQLFSDDAHPSGMFFHELVKKILKTIDICDIYMYDEKMDYTKFDGSIWLQTYVPIFDQEMEKIGLNFKCFTPHVVMINTTTRKLAKSLCEYYYFHIKNVENNAIVDIK